MTGQARPSCRPNRHPRRRHRHLRGDGVSCRNRRRFRKARTRTRQRLVLSGERGLKNTLALRVYRFNSHLSGRCLGVFYKGVRSSAPSSPPSLHPSLPPYPPSLGEICRKMMTPWPTRVHEAVNSCTWSELSLARPTSKGENRSRLELGVVRVKCMVGMLYGTPIPHTQYATDSRPTVQAVQEGAAGS